MAEKEERILIEELPPVAGFGDCGGFYTEGVGEYFCVWNGEKEPVTEEICNKCPYDKSMTREEVIETITFALCSGNCENCSDSPKGGPDCLRWLKDCGKWKKAEAALNALLEDR